LGIFQIGAQELFAWGWLRTVILLIAAFSVARITGVSHWHWTLLISDSLNFTVIFNLFFLVVLGLELRASCLLGLLGRHSITRATPPALFHLYYFLFLALSFFFWNLVVEYLPSKWSGPEFKPLCCKKKKK
jgi:hypothetical protein